MTVYSAALAYHRAGYIPIPVPFRQKGPILKDWQHSQPTEADLARQFPGGDQNIGLLNGKPSGGLVDMDLDAAESQFFLGWLPETDMISGRASNPHSHHFYDAPGVATTKYHDPLRPKDRTTLVELRSDGTQTLVPPSVHPDGEVYRWECDGKPARVAPDELRRIAGIVAAGTLVARYWPGEGKRHEASLALAGLLGRNGWDEDDAERFIGDVAQAAGDEEWRERVRNVRTTYRRLDNGGMATGAPTLTEMLGEKGEAVVGKVREWLGLGTQREWATPERGNTTERGGGAKHWPDPPAQAAYYGLAGEVVAVLDPTTEADPVAVLVSFLAAVGNAIGPGVYWEVSSKRHGLRVYPVLVGNTSKGRKGTSWGSLRPIFEMAEPGWYAKCVLSGLSSGEGLIHEVRDPIEKQEPVRKDNQRTGTILRYETVKVDAGVEDKRRLIIEEEFGKVLKLMGREGNILSAVVRQAWDDGDLRTLTKGSPETATGAHITIMGHITKDELLRYLEDTEAANGFANRFLWVCVRRSKLLPHGGNPDPATLASLGQRVAAVIEEARGYGLLRRDDAADRLWERAYGPLTEEVAGLFGAVTARGEAQVMRLAAIYAVLDCSRLIRIEHLQAALALWGYLEDSARYVFGDASGDPVADALRTALAERGKLTQTEASGLFGRNVSAARLGQAFEALRAAGQARSVTEETGGRPATVWYPV